MSVADLNTGSETYAAVDLGSNSFHLVVADVVDGHVQITDRLKEMVQLGAGLNDEHILSERAIERGVQCLQRFGQRIRHIPKMNVRAVGTNTMRRARNSMVFLSVANEALNHDIEIISGREEARLIYLGVAHTIFNETERRLVIDIGGGSTEVIIGKDFYAEVTESLHIGCINMSRRFFGDGKISAKNMARAIIAARQELDNIEALYKKLGWDLALGTSGTINSVNSIIQSQDWGSDRVTADALSKLTKDMVDKGHVERMNYQSLSEARIPIFPGGVAILSAVFETLGLEEMSTSEGALREGLVHDLIGRLHEDDIRDKTVAGLVERYGVDREQSERVAGTAVKMFHQINNDWDLSAADDLKLLRWAACLHTLGLAIAHNQYHKHGAYLLTHSDMPGFARQEQNYLGLLVRCHRRKFPVALFDEIPDPDRGRLQKLAVILRLAVVLNRGRSYKALPKIKFGVKAASISIKCPDGWLAKHPLTEADLETEAAYLQAVDMALKIKSVDP